MAQFAPPNSGGQRGTIISERRHSHAGAESYIS